MSITAYARLERLCSESVNGVEKPLGSDWRSPVFHIPCECASHQPGRPCCYGKGFLAALPNIIRTTDRLAAQGSSCKRRDAATSRACLPDLVRFQGKCYALRMQGAVLIMRAKGLRLRV